MVSTRWSTLTRSTLYGVILLPTAGSLAIYGNAALSLLRIVLPVAGEFTGCEKSIAVDRSRKELPALRLASLMRSAIMARPFKYGRCLRIGNAWYSYLRSAARAPDRFS